MRPLTYLAIIPLALTLTACQSISNPLSSDSVPDTDGMTSEMIPGDMDLEAAAEKLGVSSDDLKSALGEPPLDIPAAAEKLGVSETALRDALM